MFGMYHWYYQKCWLLFGDHGTNVHYKLSGENSNAAILSAGILTGTCEALCFTPCERVQALLQAKEYNTRFSGFFRTMVSVHADGGFREYYRGLSAILCRNGPQTALFFYLKPHVTNRINASRIESWNPLLIDFCSGAAIGAFGSTLFYPLGVAKSRMQRRLGGEFLSPVKVLRSLTVDQMYSGVSTNVIRAVASWGIINMSYEFFLGHLSLSGH